MSTAGRWCLRRWSRITTRPRLSPLTTARLLLLEASNNRKTVWGWLMAVTADRRLKSGPVSTNTTTTTRWIRRRLLHTFTWTVQRITTITVIITNTINNNNNIIIRLTAKVLVVTVAIRFSWTISTTTTINNSNNMKVTIRIRWIWWGRIIIRRITPIVRLLPIRKKWWRPTIAQHPRWWSTVQSMASGCWNEWADRVRRARAAIRVAAAAAVDGGNRTEATANSGNLFAIFCTTRNTVPVWSDGRTSTTESSALSRARNWQIYGAPLRTILEWRTKNSAGQWGKLWKEKNLSI